MSIRRETRLGLGPFTEELTLTNTSWTDVPGLTGDPAVQLQTLTIINRDLANTLEYRVGTQGSIPIPANTFGNGLWTEDIPPEGMVVDEASGAVQVRAVAQPIDVSVTYWLIPDNPPLR